MEPQPNPATGLIASKKVARDMGVSSVTLWRWKQKGWIEFVNIQGRSFISKESLIRFEERAKSGEFSQDHAGVAQKSHLNRLEKEANTKTRALAPNHLQS